MGGGGCLGRFGAGSCPNLLQRRPAAGSAARRSAEYQRFASGAPARSGSLQQIRTTCAAAGPCADGGPGDHPGARASPAPTGCRGVHFALERCILPSRGAVRSARSSAKCTSREQNAHLDEHRTDPPPTTPDGPSPHRPAPTPVPDHDPRREGPSGLTAALFCLDHLRALGPLMFRWTTVFREPGGPSARKWSNGT